jgi:Tat protein secretion system quality control protein TatD with DNase activity
MFLVDSHCHLDGLDYQTLHKNVDDVLAKAAARDVKFCLAVATTLPGYRSMRELVGTRDNVVFSCGVHPLNQDEPYEVETCARWRRKRASWRWGDRSGLFLYPGNQSPAANLVPRPHPHRP